METPRIVLADDDFETCEGVATVLRSAGYTVEVARDGEEALAACRRQRPDLLLTDLDMPKLRGEVLIDRMQEVDPTVPVAVITGEQPFDAGRRAASLGAKQFFIKPLNLEELVRRVDELLR
jgi:DNA-binding response OmpR family regulator